jgi:hypothetical protein
LEKVFLQGLERPTGDFQLQQSAGHLVCHFEITGAVRKAGDNPVGNDGVVLDPHAMPDHDKILRVDISGRFQPSVSFD